MSFCWSTSSLMVFALLPMFLSEVLQASKTKIGLIEGVAYFTAFVFKIFSGVFSDYVKKRKSLIAAGSFGTIVVKLMFAAASTISWVFVARFIDRLCMGIRAAPTDALVADISPPQELGRSYGLRYSLYTMGAVFGSGIAAACMWFSSNNYHFVFILSAIPATIALLILLMVVKAPPIVNKAAHTRPTWHIRHVLVLPPAFWMLLFITSLLMMARFSEAFMTLRARELGWSIALLPMIIVIDHIVQAAVAYPVGKLADRTNRYDMLLKGMLFLVLGNILMMAASSPGNIIFGVVVVGVHMGATQGLLAALVADATPADLRGTAFSLFYLVTGIAVLLANWLAGHLSDLYGVSGAFRGGLVFSTLACFALWTMRGRDLKPQAEGSSL
ncbi:MAG: MFS transporter [Alphaproteobacteria bacterium]